MEHVRLQPSDRTPQSPVLVYAFTGWNDAGEAASSALRAMVTHWGARPLGDIDPEPFTDFATVRPSVTLEDGRRRIHWPVVDMWTASLPGADVILVLGPEPSLRWRLFGEQIVGVASHYGVSLSISLGALLADLPHTHPVQLIGTASDAELMERFNLRRSTYEGPTGIVGVVHDALTVAGFPSTSLWATVPGYTAQLPSPKASEALVEVACSLVGTASPAGVFARAVAEYEARVAALVADDEDLASYVSRLESMMADHQLDLDGDFDDDDDNGQAPTHPSEGSSSAEAAIDTEELFAEVEQFLRDAGPDDDPQ